MNIGASSCTGLAWPERGELRIPCSVRGVHHAAIEGSPVDKEYLVEDAALAVDKSHVNHCNIALVKLYSQLRQ